MRCQGLQFSRVSQTAGNLQFNPTRFQAEQSLEQKLTLKKRVMFCITVRHLNSVSECLLKGQYLHLCRASLINTLEDLKIIALPLTEHLGMQLAYVLQDIFRQSAVILYLFDSAWHCFQFPGV